MQFKNFFHRYKKFLWLVLPIFIGAAGFGAYWLISKYKKVDTSSNNDNGQLTYGTTQSYSLYDGLEIFPPLSQYDFYEEIRIENGKPIITDDFVASVINKVIKEAQITSGGISYNYSLASDKSSLVITFNWVKSDGQNFWKTYNFSLSV